MNKTPGGWAAAWLLALAAGGAQAQLIDDVDLRREGADAVLQIRFVTPVQYRRVNVPRAGDTAQIYYDLVTLAEGLQDVPSERRVSAGGTLPDLTVYDEAAPKRLRDRRLLLRLSRAVPFKVRAGRGDRQIEVVLSGLGAAVPVAAAAAPALPTSGFQITLQRSDDPNLQLGAPIPSALQRYQVFTGQRQVDGRTVHEISLGYFETRTEAEAARAQLLARFPQASIVALAPAAPAAPAAPIAAPVPPAAVATPVPPVPAAPAPSAAAVEQQAAALLAAAKAAEAKQDHAGALDKLNELLNLPANASTREGQALAGLVRERAGDPLRARAEYETFLQLFPTGPDADQVRAALARLPAAPVAAAPSGPIVEQKARPKVEATSTTSGSVAAFYYGGQSKVRTQAFQDSPISGLPEVISDDTLSGEDQKQWQGSVDLNWRYRDADTDMRFVFRDAYTLDQLRSDKSKNRLSALYFEHRSLVLGTSVKLGRQSPAGLGVLGRFDGAQASYTVVPKWRITAVGGVPADTLLDAKRHFYGGAIEADALLPNLSGNVYVNRQMIDGELDRNAVGTELRFFSGGASATGILDWDRSIRGLNIASLQGTWQLENSAVVNFLYDKRKTPLLMLGNALFFPSATDPRLYTRISDMLADGYTLGRLRQRVKDTTSDTTQGLLGATVPINATWQVGADLRLTDVGEIQPVPDILPTGQGRSRNNAVGAQLIGSNLYSARDTHVFALSLLRGTNFSGPTVTPPTQSDFNAVLLSYNNSSQVNEHLLLEPSLRWYRQTSSDGGRLTRWTPGLRITYRMLQQFSIESEINGELTRSTSPTLNENSHRYYYYLGVRYDF